MEFEIEGAPIGKHRPRFSTINGYAQAIKVDADVDYENMVRLLFKLNKPADYELVRQACEHADRGVFFYPEVIFQKACGSGYCGYDRARKKARRGQYSKNHLRLAQQCCL